MKKLHLNLKRGEYKVEIEHTDDLWYLHSILSPGDTLKGKTFRKISSTTKDQRAKEASKKPVFLGIKLEKIEFGKTSPVLRASGQVISGPEDVPLGSHHTFSLEERTVITIIKERWLKYQKDKLHEAFSEKQSTILICVHDREEAYCAQMKKYGYTLLSHLSGSVQKKGDDQKIKGDFYSILGKQLIEYNERYSPQHIILASPAFWKEDFMKTFTDEDVKKKIVLATCSSVSENGISEVMKRPEVKEALKQERAAKEMEQVEQLLAEISKEGLAAYGLKETAQAAEAGAVQTLLIVDSFLYESREKGNYGSIEKIMNTVDKSKGDITIVSHDHEGGKKLLGIGGIGGLLRFKVSY